VSAIVRGLALEYVTGYLEGGNEKLALYRDTDRPTFVANEFRSMIEDLPPLDQCLPETKRYLPEQTWSRRRCCMPVTRLHPPRAPRSCAERGC
jgi:hypothetical protein